MGNHAQHIGIVIVGRLIGLGIVYMLYVLWSSRRAVKQADRAEYHLCDKHGMIRDSDMLTVTAENTASPELFGYVNTDGAPIKMCPVCYTERIKVATRELTKIDQRQREHPSNTN